jgi:hypothetical protein
VEPGNGWHAAAGAREETEVVHPPEAVTIRKKAEDQDENGDQASPAKTQDKGVTIAPSTRLTFVHGSRSFPREPYSSASVMRYA